ncbi:MAG: hypothetical protein KF878_05955 [Planctomycetes bacterium]|nr:hypothetical protein [Planctomycetota bacterium]
MQDARPRRARRITDLERCPFCHDDVRLDRPGSWVACQGCLARHHAGCWTEARRCAACRADGALARGGGRRPAVVALATGVLLGLVGGVGLSRVPVERLRASSTAAEVTAVVVTPAATRPTAVAAVAPERVPEWVLERLGFLASEGRRRDAEALIERLALRSETRAELRRSFEQALTAVEADRRRRAGRDWCGPVLDLGAALATPPSVVSFPLARHTPR